MDSQVGIWVNLDKQKKPFQHFFGHLHNIGVRPGIELNINKFNQHMFLIPKTITLKAIWLLSNEINQIKPLHTKFSKLMKQSKLQLLLCQCQELTPISTASFT
jgi:hypothetical protein